MNLKLQLQMKLLAGDILGERWFSNVLALPDEKAVDVREDLCRIWARALVSSNSVMFLRIMGVRGSTEEELKREFSRIVWKVDSWTSDDVAVMKGFILAAYAGGLFSMLDAYGDGVPLADILV